MGRLGSLGFEQNTNTAGVEWTSTNGSPVIQTGTVHGGTYAGQITSLVSGTEQSWVYQFAAADSSADFYFRAYLNIAAYPSTATPVIWALLDSTANNACNLQLSTAGVLSIHDNSGAQVGATTTLALNQWYRIEVRHFNTSGIVELKVDGVVIATTSVGTTAVVRDLHIGGNISSGTATSGNWFFDDVAINDTSGSVQNGYPGAGKIVHMRPTGVGDNTTWGIFAGTSNWNAVSEVTPNGNTTAVASLTVGQLDDYALTVDPGIGASDTINVVSVGVNFEGTAASANSLFLARLKAASGGTVTESAAINPTSTGYVNNSKSVPATYPIVSYTKPGGGAWTQPDLATSQIGLHLSSANTNKARISTVWMSVDYTPVTGGAGSTGQGRSQPPVLPAFGPIDPGGQFNQPARGLGGQVPNAPTSLTITADNEYRTVAQWSDGGPSGAYDATNYLVERSTDGVSYSQVNNVGNTQLYSIDLTCAAQTLYYYRVKARNSYGDSPYSSAITVMMPAVGQPWTAKIQGWLFPTAPFNPIVEYNDGRFVDTLKPEYMTVGAAGVITEEDAPAIGTYAWSPANAGSVKSYANKVLVTVSSGYTNFHALMGSGTNQTNGITTMLNFCTTNGFAGVELDWEGFGSWTSGDYSTFKTFLSTLVSSFHSSGLVVAVVLPPIGDSSVYTDLKQSLYQIKYEEIAPLVDYVVPLAYDYQFDYGAGTPIQPLTWAQTIAQWAINKVGWVNRSKIIIGIPAYGYFGVTGGFSITEDPYQTMAVQTGFSTATRDASSQEMNWANGGNSYFYNDVVSLNAKRQILEDMGIIVISVWYIGGNQWFNGRVEPSRTNLHQPAPIPPKVPVNAPSAIAGMFQRQPAYTIAVGGTLKFLTLAANLSFVGAQKNTISKSLPGQVSFSGSLAKSITRFLTATVSFTGSAGRQVSKKLGGNLSFSGAISRTTTKLLPANLSFSGSMVKSIVHNLPANLSFSGSLARSIVKNLSANLSFSGARALLVSKKLAGNLNFTGSQKNTISKSVAGNLSFSGAIAKQINKPLAGQVSFSGAITTIKVKLLGLAANLSFSGSTAKRVNKNLGSNLSFSGSIKNLIARSLVANLSLSGALSKTVGKPLGGSLNFSGSLSKLVKKNLSATVTPSGSLTKQSNKSLAASVNFVGSAAKMVLKSLGGQVSFAGVLSRTTSRNLPANLSFSGSMNKAVQKGLNGNVSFSGNTNRQTSRSLGGSLSFSGGIAKMMIKRLTAQLSFTAAIVNLVRRVVHRSNPIYLDQKPSTIKLDQNPTKEANFDENPDDIQLG